MKTIVELISLVISCTVLSGCITDVMQVDSDNTMTSQCRDGQIVIDYPLSYDNAWEAASGAIANLKFGLSYSFKADREGIMEAVHRNGEQVLIIVIRKGTNVTSVAIRDRFSNCCKDAERVHYEIMKGKI